MSMLYEYFAAPSDEAAVRVLEIRGGPLAARVSGSDAQVWDAIDGVGIEPAVNLTDLEELLTGVEYDAIIENPRAADTLASQDDQGMVITVTDALQAVLAGAKDTVLATAAQEWAHAEEFGGIADAEDLAVFLHELASLARRARNRGERLYCWVSL